MKPNAERLLAVLAHIEARPEMWDQTSWPDKGAGCYLCHAERMAGIDVHKPAALVGEWLGVTNEQFLDIVADGNTLADLHRIVEEIIAESVP